MRGFLIVSLMMFACLLAAGTIAQAATITVARDGTGDYRSIGDAVDNMDPGDEIYVKNGTYYETLVITDRVHIVGQSTRGVIVDGNQSDSPMTLSRADGSYLANMTLTNGSADVNKAGLALFKCNRITVNNVSFDSNLGSGLFLSESSRVMVNDSTAVGNAGDGVYMADNSFNVTFNGLEVHNCTDDGLALVSPFEVVLNDINVHHNSDGLYISNGLDIVVHGSSINNNTDNGVNAPSTKVHLYNTTVHQSMNETYEFVTSNGFIALTDCPLYDANISMGSEGGFFYRNFVHVLVEHKGSPVPGVDVNATENGSSVHVTEGYGGSDPQTGPDGMVEWIPLGYWYIDPAFAKVVYNGSWVNVSYKGWAGNREVNMSETHTESFDYPGANRLNVDPENTGDPSMDGSVDHPYDTITRAIDNATAWDDIIVWDGVLEENVNLNITVSIEGNGTRSIVNGRLHVGTNASRAHVSNLTFNGTDTVVNVTAGDVVLDRLFINATALAINVSGEGVHITGASISGDVGLQVVGASDIEVSGTGIDAWTDGVVLRDAYMVDLNDTHIWNFTGHGLALDNVTALNVSRTNLSIGGSPTPSTSAVNSALSQLVIQDSEFWTGVADSFVLSSGDVVTLNTTFDGDTVDVDPSASISVRNRLDIYVNRSTNKTEDDPVEGADVNVTVDGTSIYNTTYYNGTDPQTDPHGMVRGIVVENHVFDGSNTPTWRNVTIHVYFGPTPETEWTNVTYDVDMNVSRRVNYTYVAPSVNRKPWTEVDTPGEVSQNVHIDYTLFDKESDPCNVFVEYTIDGSTWLPAELQGGGSNISNQSSSPTGVDHSFTWRSYQDVPDEDIEGVKVRIWANDTKEGYRNESGEFHLDNDLNQPTVDIDNLVGEQSGHVFIYFNITDPEEARSSVFVEYEYGGSWYDATSGTGGNTSSSMKTNVSGQAYVFHWRSTTDLDGVDDNITVRMTGNDGNDNDNGTPDQISFDLDNNDVPDVDIQSSSAELSGDVEIELTLTDAESDPVDVVVQYRVNEGDEYQPATINDDTTGLDSSPGGTDHFLEWDSMTDIGEIELYDLTIKVLTSDTEEGGNDTVVYHVDNDLDPPEIMDITMPAELYGDIDITFTITDPQEANATVTVSYQVGSGVLQDATITSPYASGNRLIDIPTSSGGEEYTFTWESNAPDDFEEQFQADVSLILVAQDGQESPDVSEEFDEGPFDIENDLYLPRITYLEVTGERKAIDLDYTIADLDEVPCTITVEYRAGDDPTWESATMGSGGDGTTDLASSKDGVNHTFEWDSYEDLPDVQEEVTLRIRADNTDDIGEWVVSETFDLNNVLNVEPELQSLTVQGDHGDIDISFQVRDAEDSEVNTTLYFVLGSPSEATTTGNTTELPVGQTWTTHNFTWDSIADLGYVDATDLEVQLHVSDGTKENEISTAFDLKNGQLPRLELENPEFGPYTVNLTFTLKDDQGDDCDVEFEYSSDDGETYEGATLIENAPGESPDGMDSSASGKEHLLIWDANFDIGYGDHQDLIVRLRADDGTRMSAWYETDPFDLTISAPPNEEPEGEIYPPGDVNATDDIHIQAKVEDDTEDINVTLWYRNGANGTWIDVDMEEGGEEDVYEATVLNSDITEKEVHYYIEIFDGDNTVYADDRDEDNPMIITLLEPTDSEGGEEKTEDSGLIMMAILVVIIGVGAAVGFLMFTKKKGGGGKPEEKGAPAQPGPGLQPGAQAQPPGAMPPAHGAQPQAPQGGAQMSVCPVCGAPVMVPPQRPVRVSCNRCKNTFDVK